MWWLPRVSIPGPLGSHTSPVTRQVKSSHRVSLAGQRFRAHLGVPFRFSSAKIAVGAMTMESYLVSIIQDMLPWLGQTVFCQDIAIKIGIFLVE